MAAAPVLKPAEVQWMTGGLEVVYMRKQLVPWAALAATAALLMFGCGGGSTFPVHETLRSGSGSLVVLGSDTSLEDIVSFKVTITGLSLSSQASGTSSITTTPVSAISSAEPLTVDFASLLDFSTLLALADVPSGTYSGATITLSEPTLTFLDASQSPPAPVTVTPTLETLSISAVIDPPLNVVSGDAAALELDFNLRESVQIDTEGQITGVVNPVFQVQPGAASPEGSLAILDELHGIVRSVSTTSSSSFTGSFTLETLGGRGPTLTVNVTSTSRLDGVADLGSLLPGTFVEVVGFVDTSGSIVAQEVDAERLTNPGEAQAAFVGVITSVTRNAPPNANEFTVAVREEHPDVSLSIPLNSVITVRLFPPTVFDIAAGEVNRAGLTFDTSTLGVGQEAVVHGNFLAATPSSPGIVNAGAVFLRLQSVPGNFSTLLASGADGKTGGFEFLPGSSLFGGQAITVLTFSETEFAGVADLNALTAPPTLIVKGLLFFEQESGSLGNVSWTAPTWVLVAKRVRQLP